MNFKNLIGGICAATALVSTGANAQSFERVFYEPGTDMNHYSIETTPHGEYVIAGTLFRGGNRDIQVMMLDASGSLMWTVNLDESDDDRALDVVVDPNGDIVVVGYIQDVLSPSDADLYVVKLDAAGNFMADLQVDGFHTAAGTNVIYSYASNSYIVGGYMGEPFQVPMIGCVARVLELDMGLNITANTELSTVEFKHASINDIVEVPTGYFITGSTAITGSSPYGGEGVLAMFLDFGLNVTADLSFESTNSEHVGVSAVYDPDVDEVWLMSNNSVIHNPQISQIRDVSGSPFISTEYYLELDPTYGSLNAAGFKLDLSPYTEADRPSLVAAGLYRTATDYAGNTNSAIPWIVEFDRSNGSRIGAFTWPAPSPNFHAHGDGLFSTFSGEHPYFFNQELMVPRPDRRGFALVGPKDEGGNYAIDVFTSLELTREEMPCFERLDYDPITIGHTDIPVTDYPQVILDMMPNYPIPDFSMDERVYCDELFAYRAPEKTDNNQVKTGSSMNLGEATVSVSPNPVNSSAFVEIYGADLTNNSLVITNSLGQVAFSINLTGGDYYSNRIDMTDLPNGLYFLTLTNAEGAVAVTKLIKE